MSPALYDTLFDVFKALESGRRHRVLSGNSRMFFAQLYQTSDTVTLNYVADLLQGPSVSTIQRAFRKYLPNVKMVLGLDDMLIKHAADTLKDWKLGDAPCVISEDGTALQQRLDVMEVDGKVRVFGLSGGSFDVTSLEEVRRAIDERPVATTLYAYNLVPLVEGAPDMPLFMIATAKGTFTADIAEEVQQYVRQVRHLYLAAVGSGNRSACLAVIAES